MRRLQISGFIFCSLALLVGCNSKYVVPSYESKICTSTHDKKQNTTGANCAAALYNNALTLMKTGSHHASRELYVAAIGEYLKARTNLKKARIILAEAKLTNFQDWKIAVVLGLEKNIREKIKQCDQRISNYQWER